MAGFRYVARSAVAAALVLGSSAGLSTAAMAQDELTPEAAGREVAERYGVEVLDVAEAEENGQPVYVITVMKPGGNDNGAFMVTRLMVDPSTGELVSQFQGGPTGFTLPETATGGVTGRTDGRDIRRMSHQTP